MNVYEGKNIRNVGIVGHGGSGKTSLISAILFDTGATNRLGRVDDGNAPTDYDEDEIERKITISAKLAFCEWNKNKINMLDTPGFGNFIQEARGALRVADAAVVVVDAVSGVMVQTEKAWGYADEFQLPRMIVVNRMDRDTASFERSLESIQQTLGRMCVPIQIPIGRRKRFQGRRRPRSDEGLRLSDRRLREIHAKSAIPADIAATRTGISREADRSRGRERRKADGEVLRQRLAHRRRTDHRTEETGRRRKDLSGPVHLGDRQHRHPAAAECHCELAAGRRCARNRHGQGHSRQGRPAQDCRQRTVFRIRFQNVFRSVHRPHFAVPRLFRNADDGTAALQRQQRRRPSASVRSSCCRERHRCRFRNFTPATSRPSRS